MAAKLNLEQVIVDATERYQNIIKECTHGKDYDTIVGLTCASLYDGEDTMPVEDNTIRYQYKNGSCFFMIDGIKIEVLDCRDMRKDPSLNIERYADVCILSISYMDESEFFYHHIIPETWLYGSTTNDFDEGAEVHLEFINAASEFIKQHKVTKEMQEVEND